MFKRTKVNAGALVALGSALLGASLGAHAQATEQRIEVTGSRIKSIGSTSTSPVASVGRADIDTSQPVAVEELVRGLPAAYPAIGPGINNGSNGTASVDLRGLGSNRTLVLINGRRVVPATLGGVVDTNNVPVSLLERVDLVTGGASAVYGADAVSGVVNFVLKRNFTGVEGRAMYTVSDKNDAKRYNSDLTVGANLAEGRGNVVMHIGTTRTQAVRLGQRDYANTVISSVTGNPGGFSDTAVPAQWTGVGGTTSGIAGPSATSEYVIDPTTNAFRPSSAANPPDGYNTNPPNYFETPLTRTQFTALGRFTINDYAEVYAETLFTRGNVTLNLAPSGTFGTSLTIPIGNPFIPDAARQQLCTQFRIAAANCVVGNTTTFGPVTVRRRFVEAGPRIYSYDNLVAQYTLGLRGTVPLLDSWGYDAYFQKGRSEQKLTTANGFSTTKLRNAVNAVNTTTCVGNPTGCVPVNIFGAAGTITPAMLNYLSIPTFQTTEVRQEVISLSANGDVAIAKSPMASNPLSLALGIEKRTVFGGNRSDSVVQTQGELLGSGAPTPDREGEIKFDEYYGEARLPLLSGLPFAEALTIGGGYRGTTLKTAIGGEQKYGSWKQGLEYVPIKGLRLRAEVQRATRAPNVNELYAPIVTGLSQLSGGDPCQLGLINAADAARSGTLSNLCVQTGVPVGNVGSVPAPSSNQINQTSGGNPSLGPERADTTTIGFVWEPTFAPSLTLTVDSWKIEINGAVSSPTAGQVSAGCYNSALNPTFSFNAFCGLIQRDPLSGGLNGTGFRGISVQSSNLGFYDFRGVDVGASYRLPMSALGMPSLGRVDLSLQYSHLSKADFKALPTTPTLEQAGYYGTDVGTPYAKDRFSQRTTWTMGDLTVGYNWRFIGKSTVQKGSENSFKPEYTSIKNVNYIDLNVAYQVHKNLRLSLTVNNALDKDPPFIGTGIGPGASNFGNTFPSVYDVIGRRFVMTATATF